MDFNTYYEVLSLYASYAKTLDEGDWDSWPEYFVEACSYKLQPRENYDQGLPLATLSFESVGMLRDRVYGIRETLFHDPYYQRHIIGVPVIHEVTGEHIMTEANYVVMRTKRDQLSEVFNVGRYIDTIVRTENGLRFKSKLCVFDSEMIPNSIIYPI